MSFGLHVSESPMPDSVEILMVILNIMVSDDVTSPDLCNMVTAC